MSKRYEDLEKDIKQSFQRSLTKTVGDILHLDSEHHMIFSQEVTNEFMNEVFMDMRAKKYNQKWSDVDLEFENDELKYMVQKKVDALRKKKPTEKQVSYFNGMCEDMKKNIEMPTDYLVFQRTVKQLKEEYNQIGPATEKQIETVTKHWKNTFGEELNLRSNVTRGEIKKYFDEIRDYKFNLISN